jgi:hypothetical protein
MMASSPVSKHEIIPTDEPTFNDGFSLLFTTTSGDCSTTSLELPPALPLPLCSVRLTFRCKSGVLANEVFTDEDEPPGTKSLAVLSTLFKTRFLPPVREA